MSDQYSRQETFVLEVLESVDVLTLEQVIEHLPQLSWSQLFHTVDSLSRRGAIVLRRRGFQYEPGPRRKKLRRWGVNRSSLQAIVIAMFQS